MFIKKTQYLKQIRDIQQFLLCSDMLSVNSSHFSKYKDPKEDMSSLSQTWFAMSFKNTSVFSKIIVLHSNTSKIPSHLNSNHQYIIKCIVLEWIILMFYTKKGIFLKWKKKKKMLQQFF